MLKPWCCLLNVCVLVMWHMGLWESYVLAHGSHESNMVKLHIGFTHVGEFFSPMTHHFYIGISCVKKPLYLIVELQCFQLMFRPGDQSVAFPKGRPVRKNWCVRPAPDSEHRLGTKDMGGSLSTDEAPCRMEMSGLYHTVSQGGPSHSSQVGEHNLT